MSHIRGRLTKAADEKAARYTTSLPVDWQLYRQDVAGSIAHARMLAKQGIISAADADTLTAALSEIKQEIEQGNFRFRDDLEDIHMSIEARLIEKTGEVGLKLHTARSRNDQVAVDMRLYIRETISGTVERLRGLQRALLDVAEANRDAVMPGYTHLQPAQPVLLAHHLLAYFEMFQRDIDRCNDCLKRADVLPLGSGALAGVTYNIDRDFLARELDFAMISRNSMDAVSDRDYLLEYHAVASISMMHLSRLAEEMVLWSSAAFGFIQLDDAYATGSSIMPQKKNPDVAELARGRTGKVYGNLLALLTTMKALPLAYNRDMQEDKAGIFETVGILHRTLEVFAGMVSTMTVRADIMAQAVQGNYILATDIADYLVRKGDSFRSAYGIVAGLVSYAEGKKKSFAELSLDEYRSFSALFDNDVYNITVESSLAARDVAGGTAPSRVKEARAAARRIIEQSNQ